MKAKRTYCFNANLKILLVILCTLFLPFEALKSEDLSVPPKNHLRDGERLVFDIKYGVISAGEAALTLQKSEYMGNDVWKISSSAETNAFFDKVFKVRDNIESIATLDEMHSIVYTKRLNEGKYRQHRIHQNYLQQNLSIYSVFRFRRGEWEDQRMEIPAATFDLMSAFYSVRTMDLEPGQVIELNVTTDGNNYNALVKVLRKETINTVLGKKECLVLEPGLDGEAIFKQTGEIHIWVTNDDYKIPVLMQSKIVFGNFKALLKSVF